MLRLVLDWFGQNRKLDHKLSFLPGARWYSEALLPSRFHPQSRRDNRGESFTHADGIVGHFSIQPGERGEATLEADARQFVVIEAKLGSGLSQGVKNAKDFDQAARNVACMAHMLGNKGIRPDTLERLAFYVIAPQEQIDGGVFGSLVTKDSIREKVAARVTQYDGQWDTWLRTIFEQALGRMDVGLLSWEEILAFLLAADSDASALREFYARCIRFNPLGGRRLATPETPTAESIEATIGE